MREDDRTATPSRPDREEPSWGHVLATTIQLWATRRLRGPRVRRWRLLALVLALAVGTGAALGFTGVFTGARSTGARNTPGTARTAAHSSPSKDPAVTARSQAAAWIAAQVGTDEVIACYPDMCSALEAKGVQAGRLLQLAAGAAAKPAAGVLVTSLSQGPALASKYAPGLIASFGSGQATIDVRVVGSSAAAYETALTADLAARKVAGPQLLNNNHLQFTGPDSAELQAGEVDSRLLLLLPALAYQHALRVTSFSDAAPGAPQLYRQVTLTSTDTANAAAELNAVLAIVRAQTSPYAPAHAAIIHPAAGQSALSIAFAIPGPLGLLAGAVP